MNDGLITSYRIERIESMGLHDKLSICNDKGYLIGYDMGPPFIHYSFGNSPICVVLWASSCNPICLIASSPDAL